MNIVVDSSTHATNVWYYIQDDGCGHEILLFCAVWPVNSGENTALFTMQNGLVAALLVLADGSCTSATCTTHDSTATRKLQTLSKVLYHGYHTLFNSLAPGVCRPKQRTVI